LSSQNKKNARATTSKSSKKTLHVKRVSKAAPVKKVASGKVVKKAPVKKADLKKIVKKNVVAKKVVKKVPVKNVVEVKKSVVKKAVVKTSAIKNSVVSSAKVSSRVPVGGKSEPASKKPGKKMRVDTSRGVSTKNPKKVPKKSIKHSPAKEKKVILKKSQEAIQKTESFVESGNYQADKSSSSRPAGVVRAVFRENVEKKKVVKPEAVPVTDLFRESAPDLLSDNDPGFLDSSEVFDEAEHAQHQQLREQAAIQERARLLARPETHPDFDGFHCVDCDDELPAFRLKIGRVRCVDCQQAIEDRQDKWKQQQGLSAQSHPKLPEDWHL